MTGDRRQAVPRFGFFPPPQGEVPTKEAEGVKACIARSCGQGTGDGQQVTGDGRQAVPRFGFFPPPQPQSTGCDRVHCRNFAVGSGFEVLAVFTIWVKVRVRLSDTLHHAVGEMPGRAEGVFCQRGRFDPIDLGCRCPCELVGTPLFESTPLLVASSSRPPADASGGQKNGPLLHHKPWIEAQWEVLTEEAEGVKNRIARQFGQPTADGGQRKGVR